SRHRSITEAASATLKRGLYSRSYQSGSRFRSVIGSSRHPDPSCSVVPGEHGFGDIAVEREAPARQTERISGATDGGERLALRLRPAGAPWPQPLPPQEAE